MPEQLNITSKLDEFENFLHDIKTPLSTIFLSIEMLDMTESNEFNNSLLKIRDYTKDLVDRITDQLAKECKVQSYEKNVDVVSVMQNAITILYPIAKKKNSSILFFQDIKLREIDIDPLVFERILFNLIENAIKHCDEFGTVKIVSKDIDDKLIINISNTGKGISKDIRQQMFKRKFSSCNSMGLGLNIVENMVTSLNGTIKVRNSENYTTFNVKIPIKSAKSKK